VNIVKSFLTAFLALPLCAAIAGAQVPSLDAHVNLQVLDRTVEDVIVNLREHSGANIVVIDPVNGAPISSEKLTIELTDVPWRDALELVAEKVGGVVEERTGGVLVVTRPKRVRMDFKDQEIREVIEAIAMQGGANIVLSREVTGTVSGRFNDVPWREALEVTAKSLGFAVITERYGILRVVDPKTLQDQLETRTYQLRFLRPQSAYKPQIKSEFIQSTGGGAKVAGGDYMKTFTVLAALGKAMSPAGKIDYIDTANVVIVQDTAQVQEAIKLMLMRLDVEPLQVFCDVKFVSTTNSDILNLGVDYGDNGPQVSLSGGQIPVTFPFNPGTGGPEDWIIASPNGHGPYIDPTQNAGNTTFPDTIFGALSFTQLQATLRLLQRDSKSEVIQAPKIFALDGREATIFVGETIRYAEAKSEQGQSGGLQLSVAEAQGSPVEVGFQLLIRPNIIPGTNKIVMEVIPKETSLSGTGNSSLAPPGFDVFTIGASGLEGSIALPRTRSSTIVTTMMIDSGRTAIIGGLTTDSDVETKTRVPFLSKIPVLGELFKHESSQRDRRSLMVLLTPTIVHSSEDTELLLQQEVSRRRASLKDQIDALVGQKDATGTSPIKKD
jgi:type II secretory pathway component GspD/PulD (secretin)